ncbi:MAG: molybdopterin-guanine dinucleotide biosynthesis protein MobB [Neobacillus sp.]|jgi:molybdopterin-guanine dinucleotide biosynthesis protein B|nr:molybdopterin-guanine dinucleotide biosynthesis protein MobB [Neobacillus sp.]
MAVVKPVIFQVVGYQNSGKTTFLIRLIQALTKEGLKAVTIKHHGHGGKPEGERGKDTGRHLEAGALATLVEGDGRLILQAEDSNWSLAEQIRLMEFFKADVILIEGHKLELYPKLLILRDKADLSLLDKVDNISWIIYWEDSIRDSIQLEIPSFHIDDEASVHLITQNIKKCVQKIEDKC